MGMEEQLTKKLMPNLVRFVTEDQRALQVQHVVFGTSCFAQIYGILVKSFPLLLPGCL